MDNKIKRMDIKEFMEMGFLQKSTWHSSIRLV